MPIEDYTPSVTDLARLIPSRAAARFTGGAGAPAFPDETRVSEVIADSVGIVSVQVGGDQLPAKFNAAAKALVKLHAALELEPSAWPEQARPDKSAWEQWEKLYDKGLDGLMTAIAKDAADGAGDGGPEGSGMPAPAFGFPSGCCDHIEGSELPNDCCVGAPSSPLFWVD